MYRLVSGDVFLGGFASDRRHMVRDGEYISPPPVWPAICNEGLNSTRTVLTIDWDHNMDLFIDMMHDDDRFGRVLQENEFLEFCTSEAE
jgi:hypothetical protein